MPNGPAEAGHPTRTTAWAVVVAGGSGTRFGGYKQFMALAGREVVDWSLEAAAGPALGSSSWSRPRRGKVRRPGRPCRGRRADPGGSPSGPGSRRSPTRPSRVVHDAARPLASRRCGPR